MKAFRHPPSRQQTPTGPETGPSLLCPCLAWFWVRGAGTESAASGGPAVRLQTFPEKSVNMQGLLGAMLQVDASSCAQSGVGPGSGFACGREQGKESQQGGCPGAQGPAREDRACRCLTGSGDAVPDPAVKSALTLCALGDSPSLGPSWAPAGRLASPQTRSNSTSTRKLAPLLPPLTGLCLPQLGKQGSDIIRIVSS